MGVTFSLTSDCYLVLVLILTNPPCVLCVKGLWQIHQIIKSVSPDTGMLPLIYPLCPMSTPFVIGHYRADNVWRITYIYCMYLAYSRTFTSILQGVFYKMQTTEYLADNSTKENQIYDVRLFLQLDLGSMRFFLLTYSLSEVIVLKMCLLWYPTCISE